MTPTPTWQPFGPGFRLEVGSYPTRLKSPCVAAVVVQRGDDGPWSWWVRDANDARRCEGEEKTEAVAKRLAEIMVRALVEAREAETT